MPDCDAAIFRRMTEPSSTADHLVNLLRLIDDETPQVRDSIARELDGYSGDVSEMIADRDIRLSSTDERVLSRLLQPARRRRLEAEWVVPSGGATALHEDWERVEALLRLLSDFLHDGITVRQPLGDAIDFLAESAEPAFANGGVGALCHSLFAKHLRCDPRADPSPTHFDLAAVAAGGPSNALGLGAVALLVSQRLDAGLDGLNLPGTFFLTAVINGESVVLDPANGARRVDPDQFAHRIRRFPREVRKLAQRPATPAEVLVRLVEETATAFALNDETTDAELMERLVDSLVIPF
jgi:hypothetical protein